MTAARGRLPGDGPSGLGPPTDWIPARP